MIDRFRVSSMMSERLRGQGVAPEVVVQRAGLPAGFFHQARIHATTAELFALWRAVAASSPDPAIGLKLGSEQRLEHFNPTAIAAVCSRTFRDALQRIARYKRLTCPEEIRVLPMQGEHAVEFAFTQAEGDEPAVLVDLCLSWILSIGRRGTDGRITPLRVELTRPAGHTALLEGHYGCRVRFRSRRNALVFSSQDLERTFVTHNLELLASIGAHLEADLQAADRSEDVCGLVKTVLKRSMAGKRPTVQSVSQELGLSERTLQRRLTDAGRPFQRLAEETRRELAHHYLRHGATEYQEVAYLLGYEDTNSFFRAFHQWEGTTPGAWRASHEERTAATA